MNTLTVIIASDGLRSPFNLPLNEIAPYLNQGRLLTEATRSLMQNNQFNGGICK
ncbi:hypothetical protein AB3R30_15980 [Leptolyngbyaceae cyanobacterium UHCC 1019]